MAQAIAFTCPRPGAVKVGEQRQNDHYVLQLNPATQKATLFKGDAQVRQLDFTAVWISGGAIREPLADWQARNKANTLGYLTNIVAAKLDAGNARINPREDGSMTLPI